MYILLLKHYKGNMIFSAPMKDRYPKFLVKIPLANGYLFIIALSVVGNSFAT